ncbi:MAG TPA: hypothetical protein VHY91_05830 [Pirellulales bacterium]|nr:hypothetical protein [Pirellulales bacterium]
MDEKQDEPLGWLWLWALAPIIMIAAMSIGPVPMLRWLNGLHQPDPVAAEPIEKIEPVDGRTEPAQVDAAEARAADAAEAPRHD